MDILSDSGDDQQQELENIINDLEEENMYLMEEYTRLQNQLNTASNYTSNTLNRAGQTNTHNAYRSNTSTLPMPVNHQSKYTAHNSRALSTSPTQTLLPQGKYNQSGYKSNNSLNNKMLTNSVYNKIPPLFTTLNSTSNMQLSQAHTNGQNKQGVTKETQMMQEARLLRQHEDRLEARMKILENHNRLLDSQLKQLRNLLNDVSLEILVDF